MSKILTILILLHITSITKAQDTCRDIENEVFNNQQCTKIRTYKSNELFETPILVIALHGDAYPRVDDSLYEFAKELARTNSNLVAVAMLRPGFIDLTGRQSDGEEGRSIGDNYDEPRAAQLAGRL